MEMHRHAVVVWNDENFKVYLNDEMIDELDNLDYIPAYTQIATFEHGITGEFIPVWLCFPLNMELMPMDISLATIQAHKRLLQQNIG